MTTQILLNPIGSGGDVFPFLAIGRELQKRGHHVAVMTNRQFIENVGQAGLEFIEIGTMEALRDVSRDPSRHDYHSAWKLALKWGAVGTMRQSYQVISERVKKCKTMLVAPCIGLGARIASEKLRIPLATVVLSPFVIRSVRQSPIIKPMILSDWIPAISKRIQLWFADQFFIDPLLKSEISELRRELGLPPRSRFLHRWCFSEDLVLALFPEVFAPLQSDWPANTRLTGMVSWDPPVDSQLKESLDRFIRPGKKTITVLAGSAGPDSIKFIENWIQATRQMDSQLILLERNKKMIPSNLPSHVFHAEFFPMDEAAARSSLVAHSGSVGTTLRSLAAGVPQIVFPRVNDQPDNADRVRRLGVGRVVRFDRLEVDQIVSAVTQVMNDQKIAAQCAKRKKELPDIDAVALSCDLIEAAFALKEHAGRQI